MFLDEGIDIPPKSPFGKGGLGPATQEKVVVKEHYLVFFVLRLSSFFVVQYLHYVFR